MQIDLEDVTPRRRPLMETPDGDYAELHGDYSVRYTPAYANSSMVYEFVPTPRIAATCHGGSRAPRARSRRVRSSSNSDDPGEPAPRRRLLNALARLLRGRS